MFAVLGKEPLQNIYDSLGNGMLLSRSSAVIMKRIKLKEFKRVMTRRESLRKPHIQNSIEM